MLSSQICCDSRQEVKDKILELGLIKKRNHVTPFPTLVDIVIKFFAKKSYEASFIVFPPNPDFLSTLPNAVVQRFLKLIAEARRDHVQLLVPLKRESKFVAYLLRNPNISEFDCNELMLKEKSKLTSKLYTDLVMKHCLDLEKFVRYNYEDAVPLPVELVCKWKNLKHLGMLGYTASNSTIKKIVENLPNLEVLEFDARINKHFNLDTVQLLSSLKKLKNVRIHFFDSPEKSPQKIKKAADILVKVACVVPNIATLDFSPMVTGSLETHFGMVPPGGLGDSFMGMPAPKKQEYFCGPLTNQFVQIYGKKCPEKAIFLPVLFVNESYDCNKWPQNLTARQIVLAGPFPSLEKIYKISAQPSEMIIADVKNPVQIYGILERFGSKLVKLAIVEPFLRNFGNSDTKVNLYKIMSLCPNLEDFTVQLNIFENFPRYGITPSHFRKMKRFHLENFGDHGFPQGSCLQGWYSISKMVYEGSEHLEEVFLQTPDEIENMLAVLRQSSSSMQNIKLLKAVTHEREESDGALDIGLELMLRSPYLRKIKYYWKNDDGARCWWENRMFRKFARYLGIKVSSVISSFMFAEDSSNCESSDCSAHSDTDEEAQLAADAMFEKIYGHKDDESSMSTVYSEDEDEMYDDEEDEDDEEINVRIDEFVGEDEDDN